MADLLFGLGIWFLVAQIVGIVSFILRILQLIRLFKREDKTAAISILVVGIILIFIALIPLFWLFPLLWIPTVIALFLGRDPEEEEVKKSGDFRCGICNIKYREDFLGGETAYEGKICRACLGKKHRGEVVTPKTSPESTASLFNQEPKYKSSSEKRLLFRELNRKKSKKNSYLTYFIINLAIMQWLFPLITLLIFWIQIKEQANVEATRVGLGSSFTIPFKVVIKDLFKILTSDSYTYDNCKIIVSVFWKIGIVLVFLLPLILWIYNLVRFLSVKGEVEQLETEIEEMKS